MGPSTSFRPIMKVVTVSGGNTTPDFSMTVLEEGGLRRPTDIQTDRQTEADAY